MRIRYAYGFIIANLQQKTAALGNLQNQDDARYRYTCRLFTRNNETA